MCRYRKHWNMDLVLRPFFLGGVMKASGNKPPMTVASKGIYMEKDLRRNAEYFGINIKFVAVNLNYHVATFLQYFTNKRSLLGSF